MSDENEKPKEETTEEAPKEEAPKETNGDAPKEDAPEKAEENDKAAEEPAEPKIPLEGVWKTYKNENLEEYLTAMGIGFLKKKMILKAPLTVTIEKKGDKMKVSSSVLVMSNNEEFTLGEEFETTAKNGAKMKCTATLEGDTKLTVDMKPVEEDQKPQKCTRWIEEEELITSLEIGDVVAKRYFKKQQ